MFMVIQSDFLNNIHTGCIVDTLVCIQKMLYKFSLSFWNIQRILIVHEIYIISLFNIVIKSLWNPGTR